MTVRHLESSDYAIVRWDDSSLRRAGARENVAIDGECENEKSSNLVGRDGDGECRSNDAFKVAS